jgi:hypothetical protein
MAAATKVRTTGIPSRAVDDRLLRAVLEEGALEDDTDMQDRWTNLLANAAVGESVPHVAFPGLLAQVSPVEARMLDAMYRTLDAEFSGAEPSPAQPCRS